MIWKAWRNESFPIVAVFIALIGLFAHRLSLMMIGSFFWLLTLLSSQLAHRSLRHLTVSTRLNESYAEIGQSVETDMVVTNPLPWPIIDLQWKIDLPQALEPQGSGMALATPGSTRQTLAGHLWIGGHQRVRIRYRLTGLHRGRWSVGPGSLIFKDPLSWNEMVREDQNLYHLTVWPQRYTLPQNFWSSDPTSGGQRGRPWDPQDPLRVIGVRPYQPGDPVRQIAPYPSARTRQLMVKQLESVVDRSVEVIVHPKTADHHWHGIDRELLEETISVGATVVESAVSQGLRTGLSSTGAIAGHVRGFTFPAEKRHDSRELLTALAWTQPSGTMDEDLPHVLSRIQSGLHPGTVLIMISPYWPDVLTDRLQPQARRGLRVIFLQLGFLHQSIPPWVRDIWHFTEGAWSHE